MSTGVTPALGAGHPVDRVHRSSVPGGNPRFSPKISEEKATDQQRPAQAPYYASLSAISDRTSCSLVSWPGDHRRRSPATLGRRIGQKHLYDTELRTIFQKLFEFRNSAKRYPLVSDKRRRLNIPRDHQRLNTPVA